MKKERTYLCIDMKSFFASVECAERGLNPFETNLVVADESRGENALCLAITPKMKSLGIKNRCRLSEIPKGVKYLVAKPRMRKYIEYNGDIYEIYRQYIAKEDIHPYSIDESFLDVTEYLSMYGKTPQELAKFLINEIAEKTHIPATAGIGTNLYLAKVALDITAKHSPDHIGYLDEEKFKETLWDHTPLTDFWGIGYGTTKRLTRYGLTSMRRIANCPEKLLYREFGINAELLIDHAWGKESCTMKDIKSYKSKSKSMSSSQILFEDYNYEKARIVIKEMTLSLCQRMMKERVIAGTVSVCVIYSKNIAPATGGSIKMRECTSSFAIINEYVEAIFRKTTFRDVPIRRLSVAFGKIADEGCEGYDLFTDFDMVEREKKAERAVLNIKQRFGKNAILRGIDLQDGATQIERNKLIGGHNSD